MKVVNASADDWDEYLSPVAFSYRCGKQASTSYSPFGLMYGVEPLMPVELHSQLQNVVDAEDDITEEEIRHRIEDIAGKISGVRTEAHKNIDSAKEAI